MRLALSVAVLLSSGCANDADPAENARLSGELEKYVVDYEDGTHRVAYSLRRDDGVRIELATEALSEELRSGDRVVLQGQYSSDSQPLSERDGLLLASQRFIVRDAAKDPTGLSQQALVAPPDVTVKAAVVLLNFNGRTAQNYSAATARSEVKEVEDYYNDMSYNSWHMLTDVFGPYVVDTPTQCNLETLSALARKAATAQGVDLSGYDHLGVKIPGIDGLDCPCGVAFLGNPPARGSIRNGGTSLYTCGGSNAYAHEMGHGIGLAHSSTAPCNGVAYRAGLEGCMVIEYGNAFNTMGNGLGHFNAAQKSMLGWLNGCNLQRVSKDAEFDLKAIQLGVDNEPQGLQIATGDTRNGKPLYFYVEYRNPSLTKFNAKEGNGTVREKGPGLHVTVSRDFREGDGGEDKTILIDASKGLKGLPLDGKTTAGDPRMLPGDVFKPNNNVTIEFVSQTNDTAHVKISFPGGGSGTNECQPSKVPPGPGNVPAGVGAQIFQNCDYGGWAVDLPEGKYTAADLKALGAKDNDASSLVLAVGYDAILYADDNFAGRSVTRTASLACFNDIQLNDQLSSIEIKANGMAPPPRDAGSDASAVSDDAGSAPDAPGSDAGVSSRNDSGASARDAGKANVGGDGGRTDDTDEGDRKSGGCSTSSGADLGGSWLVLLLGALALRLARPISSGVSVNRRTRT